MTGFDAYIVKGEISKLSQEFLGLTAENEGRSSEDPSTLILGLANERLMRIMSHHLENDRTREWFIRHLSEMRALLIAARIVLRGVRGLAETAREEEGAGQAVET
jgi:hypothetical protein